MADHAALRSDKTVQWHWWQIQYAQSMSVIRVWGLGFGVSWMKL